MHFDHVGLSVQDLNGMANWYAKAFGWTVAEPFEVPPIGLKGLFAVGSDGVAIEFLQREGSTRPWTADSVPQMAGMQGFGHIALRVEDVDATHDHLVSLGAKSIMDPRPAPVADSRMAYVADPEGNFIELLTRKGPVGS
jgi:catechol 2,3-dioxygenase-like lactoylglutathione lyase family enzyme